jgi:hypothetical protein
VIHNTFVFGKADTADGADELKLGAQHFPLAILGWLLLVVRLPDLAFWGLESALGLQPRLTKTK